MSSHSEHKRKRSIGRWIVGLLVLVLILLIGGELFARFGLGLGTPPLTMKHPTIEYMFVPNQDVYRFGNHQKYNRYGMRSDDFPAQKGDNEIRVMVFGDSVINGGNQTDQSNLATSILKKSLEAKYPDKSIVVGNISAGSWGPGNMLAYAEEYGFFGADVVIVVISSHDAKDVPSFGPLDPTTHPTQAPWSALWEGATRYLPRYFPTMKSKSTHNITSSADIGHRTEQSSLYDLRQFLQLAKDSEARVSVIQYLEETEIKKQHHKEGFDQIRAVCGEMDVPVASTEQSYTKALTRGETPYRDYIHPNEVGQKYLFGILLDVVQAAINDQVTPHEE